MDNTCVVSVFEQESIITKDPMSHDRRINCSSIVPQHLTAMCVSENDTPFKVEYNDFQVNIYTASIRRPFIGASRDKETGRPYLGEIQKKYPGANISSFYNTYTVSKQFAIVDEVVDQYISYLIQDNSNKNEIIETLRNLGVSNRMGHESKMESLLNRNLFQRIFRVGE